MSENEYPWMGIYRAALLEIDPARLQALIVEAEKAIQARFRQVESEGLPASAERQALLDALQGLRVLRREQTAKTAMAPPLQ